MDDEYDQVLNDLKELDEESKKYLKKETEYFGTKISFHNAKLNLNGQLIKVPDVACDKAEDEEYEFDSKIKGFKLYSTAKSRVFYAFQFYFLLNIFSIIQKHINLFLFFTFNFFKGIVKIAD